MMLDDFDHLIANIKADDTSTANMEKSRTSTGRKEAKGVGTMATRSGLDTGSRSRTGGSTIAVRGFYLERRSARSRAISARSASLMNTPMPYRGAGGDPADLLFDQYLACSTTFMSSTGLSWRAS